MAILRRAGFADLDRLADRGFEFPSHDELASKLEKIQGVEKAFFRRFWMVSGRETVRAIAAAQLEAVSIFCIGGFVGSSFVGALLMFPFLQEKDVVNALEGRVGDDEPPVRAGAAAERMVAQGEASNQQQV